MAAEYFVASERDTRTEKEKNYGERMLFDKLRQFDDAAEARKFALSGLPSVMGRMLPVPEDDKALLKGGGKPYLVIATFEGKFVHSSYDGSTDKLKTHDAIRCSGERLEEIVETLAREGARKIVVGAEMNLYDGT